MRCCCTQHLHFFSADGRSFSRSTENAVLFSFLPEKSEKVQFIGHYLHYHKNKNNSFLSSLSHCRFFRLLFVQSHGIFRRKTRFVDSRFLKSVSLLQTRVRRSFYGALHTSCPHQRGRHPHPDRLRPSRRHCQTGRFLRSPLRGAERGRICRVAPRRREVQRRLPAAAQRRPQGGPLHRRGAGGLGSPTSPHCLCRGRTPQRPARRREPRR